MPLAPKNHRFRLLRVIHQSTLPMAGIYLEFVGPLPPVTNVNRIDFALATSSEFLAGMVRVLLSWESPTFARRSTSALNRYLNIEKDRACNLLRPQTRLCPGFLPYQSALFYLLPGKPTAH